MSSRAWASRIRSSSGFGPKPWSPQPKSPNVAVVAIGPLVLTRVTFEPPLVKVDDENDTNVDRFVMPAPAMTLFWYSMPLAAWPRTSKAAMA